MMSSPAPVVLPSIHEMFPEYLMTQPAHPRAHRKSMPSSRSAPFHHPYSPPFRTSELGRHPTPPGPSPQQQPATAHVPRALRPNPTPHHSSPSPDFSFDVLRSDPSSSSLQHIASSVTFHANQNRAHGHSPSSSISSDTHHVHPPVPTPTFRVTGSESISPISVSPVSDSPMSSPLPNHRTSPRQPRVLPNPPLGTALPPSIPPNADPSPRVYTYPSPPGSTSASGPLGSSYSTLSFPVSGSSSAPARNAAQRGGNAPSPGSGGSSRGRSPTTNADEGLDSNAASDGEFSSNGKKHICPICSKRFNRPSSLRIHVNTHTGETPFRCPWPDCGREFNVNSNMRRHYRNHTTPGFSRPHAGSSSSPPSTTASIPTPASHNLNPTAVDRRRRSRITPHGLAFVAGDGSASLVASSTLQASFPHQSHHRLRRRAHSSVSDMGEDRDASDDEEVDELGMDVEPTTDRRPLYSSVSSYSRPSSTSFGRYSQSHIRASAGEDTMYYTPSPLYARADTARVSTMLRPAFNNNPVKAEQ